MSEYFFDSIEYGQNYFCKCGHSLNWHTAGYFELNRRDNGMIIENPKHRFCYCPHADCNCQSFSPINDSQLTLRGKRNE